MTSRIFKLEGAGNDFLLGVGDWAERFNSEPHLVRRLCDRRRGIGADGTLAFESVASGRVRLGYRNADGSEGDFCANGTRCAARAAVEIFGYRENLVVETGWAEIPAEVSGRQVSLVLPLPSPGIRVSEIEIPESISEVRLMKIGVPHLVIETTGLSDLDLQSIAPPLRRHEALGPEGANIDFFEIAPTGEVLLRTWERGVEGETLACGSGMVAVALIVMAERGTDRVELVPASGECLVVDALGKAPVCATRLTGPTRIVASIEPAEELLS